MGDRRSWIVLGSAAVVLTLCMGMRQSFGLFQQPIIATLPVSPAGFGFAIALQSLIWGIAQPGVGMLADRYGARPVVVGGSVTYAIGLVVMLLATEVWMLSLGAGVLIGIGVAASGFGILMGAVAAHVPPEKRSEALGIVAALGSFGTFFIAPLSQWIIGSAGWQQATGVLVVIATAMIPFALMLGRKPAIAVVSLAEHQTLREALREAAQHKGFLLLMLGFFACGFQLIFLVTHLPTFLSSCGLSPMIAAQSLGIIGLANVVGTYGMGWLGGRFSKKRLLAVLYAVRTITIVVYLALPITEFSTLVFATMMGLFWLGTAPLTSGLVAQLFGLRHFSMLYGFVFLSHQVGSFLGAWVGGLVFDATGSYDAIWIAMVAVGFSAVVFNLLMDDDPVARLRTAPSAAA